MTAAGTPTPRPGDTVTTAAELDALPVGSVLLDVHGYPWHKGAGSWSCSSDGGVTEPHRVTPLTVLFRPDTPQEDDTAGALHLAMSTLTRTLDDVVGILGADAKACEIDGEIDPDLMWETLAAGYVPLAQRRNRPDAPQPAPTDEAVERAALTHARAFVPDVQEVINDDAGDDPDPQWVYDRLIESLAVIDSLVEALGGEYARAEHATRVGEIAARAAVAAVTAEAERRYPSYPAVGFSGADDRQRAFRDGAGYALAARGDSATTTEVEWGVRWSENATEAYPSETAADAAITYSDAGTLVQRTVSAWREVTP